jgi:photosystem II stability/assembly factor-like uncharacterized protein
MGKIKFILLFTFIILFQVKLFSQSGWIQLPTPTSNILFSVHFEDTLTGWAVGQSGTILKTTNGGNTWFFQQSGVTAALRSVCFLSTILGWVAGDNGVILKTTNGGVNWIIKDAATTKNMRSIFFMNSNYGWAVGDGGTIIRYYYTSDSWLPQSSPVTSNLNCVYFNSSTGWAAGNAGIILKTTSTGSSWQIVQNLGSLHNFSSIYFPSATTGYAAGVYQDNSGLKVVYTYKTPSGGDYWIYQLAGTTKIIHSLIFSNEDKGIAVGDSGSILITLNGGDNWVGQDSRTFRTLNSVSFPTLRNGWAVGDNGTILKTITSGYYDTLNTNRRDLGVIPIVLNSTLLLNAKYRVMFRAPDTSYNILRSLNNGTSFDTIYSHLTLSDTGKTFDGLLLRVNRIRFSMLNPPGNDTGNVGVVQDPGLPANYVQTRLPGWDYFPSQNRYLEGSKYIFYPSRPWQSHSMSISYPTKNTFTGIRTMLSPENIRKVKLVFTGYGNGQIAYRYVATSIVNYQYRNMKELPFKVFEIDETDSTSVPRQSNCAFVEDSTIFQPTGVWDPTSDSLGSKKVLYIFNSNYSPSPDTFYTHKNLMLLQGMTDVMYVWSPKLIAPGLNFHVNDEFTIYPYTVTRPDIVPGFPLYYEFVTQTYIGITKISTEVPKTYSLSQNYPNPFNPTTKIKFDIASNVKQPARSKAGETSNVKLLVYDILGREIAILVNEQLKPGTYEISWDASQYASGIYFYKLMTDEFTEAKKMVLIK